MIKAELIKQSKYHRTGDTATTFRLTYPLPIHAQLLTHRVFARNTESGRAIPITVKMQNVVNDTVMPIWTKNQKGMQGQRVTDIATINKANALHEELMKVTCEYVTELDNLGIHKQNANRYLHAFSHVQVIVTSTEWDNWFNLRYDTDAQPEIHELAKAMAAEMYFTEPEILYDGEWHTPFADDPEMSTKDRKLISASVCAQVSYLKSDATLQKANDIFDRLVQSKHLHASPFEHVCRGLMEGETQKGNLKGFLQYRQEIEAEFYDQAE